MAHFDLFKYDIPSANIPIEEFYSFFQLNMYLVTKSDDQSIIIVDFRRIIIIGKAQQFIRIFSTYIKCIMMK